MKFIALTLLTSTLAFASVPDKIAKELDTAREGDLQKVTLEFYKTAFDPLKGKCSHEANQEAASPDYRIIRLEGSSGIDKPYEGTPPFEMTTTYMVLKYCFMGTTGAGAERFLEDAVVIESNRYGHLGRKGQIIPTRADQFKKLRNLDKALFAPNYGN